MEWEIVTVIGALIALGTAVVVPLIRLNTTITRLNIIVESMGKAQEERDEKNTKAHERIWTGIGENTDRLNVHETRITVLETKG